jgi:hypothetical protein
VADNAGRRTAMFGVQIDLSETTIRFKGSHLHVPRETRQVGNPSGVTCEPGCWKLHRLKQAHRVQIGARKGGRHDGQEIGELPISDA